MEPRRADWEFPAEAASVARARTLVGESLRALPEASLEVVLLLTSELVTNAVRHGTGPVRVHVAWEDGGVRVEVEDQSARWPHLKTPDRQAVDGRGLLLVDTLSSGWGVQPRAGGKTVWFTCDA